MLDVEDIEVFAVGKENVDIIGNLSLLSLQSRSAPRPRHISAVPV